MVNYVNEGAFFDWYTEKTGHRPDNSAALLQTVFDRYLATNRPEFVLSASDACSGREECFPFRFEDLGCCGASTYFIYFGETAL